MPVRWFLKLQIAQNNTRHRLTVRIEQSPLWRLEVRVLELPEFKGEHIGLRV